MQPADVSPGSWPPPSPGGPPDPPPAAAVGDPDRRLALISAVLVVVIVLASLITLALRAARNEERAVVPVDQSPTSTAAATAASTTAPATTVPATTAPSRTTAATTVPPTTVPSTTATTVPATTVPPTTVPPTTVPPTTVPPTTVPPTTVPPTTAPDTAVVTPATVPAATVLGAESQPPEAQAALENARAIAAALADGDWAAARRLGPTDRRRTDAQLRAGYGAATDVTLLPARVTDQGRRTDLRLGLVAHEEHDSGPATAVMCVHWRVDNTTRAVERVSSVRLRLEPGIVDPADVADELLATCARYPLR